MLNVTLTLATGKQYDLTGHTTSSPVLSPEAALVPLVGEAVRTDLAVPAGHGVLPGRRRYGAIQAEIPFYLHANNGEEMAVIYKEFRAGWHLYDDPRAIPCQLSADADRPGGPYTLDLYLDRHIPGPTVDMRHRTSTELTLAVFGPTGLYRSATATGTGTVTIDNGGDGEIYPRIKTPGGGTVTAPSGATFTLPDEPIIINTHPQTLRTPGILPESVAPGGSATWELSPGVELQWELLVGDPWA